MHDKKYIIKVYKQGQYQGTLPYNVQDYQYSQDINTAGSEIVVKLGTDLKGAGIGVSVDYLVDKTGNHITDNTGNRITVRKDYVFTNLAVDLGNQIDIYLYYSGAPNGKRIFTGLVSSWESDEEEATITLTALSYGVQLDNYLIQVLPGTDLLRFPSSDSVDVLFHNDVFGPYNRTISVAQTFQVVTTTTIASVSFGLHKSSSSTFSFNANVSLYAGSPTGSQILLGTASSLVTNTALHAVTFTFPSAISVVPSTVYSIQVTTDGGVDYAISADRDSTGAYTGGSAYTYNDSTATWSVATGNYAFSVTTASASIGHQFLSVDPSTILTSLIDTIQASGSVITYDFTTVDQTNTVVTYNFKYNTVLDGVQKVLELAPPNWYWYVDVGTNYIHMHRYNLTPNYTFIKGREIEKLNLKYSLEQMKNSITFSGGDNPLSPGTNIISQKSNNASIAKYGQWLEKDADNRVTLQSTADLLTTNILGAYSRPIISAKCTVLASKFDIEQLNIGNMIGFGNFNDITNSAILQIVSMTKRPDKADLILATLPPTQTHRIEDIKRNLDNLNTENNPTS